jgi:hypothetical protein
MAPKFSLGQVVATPGALEALERAGKTPAAVLRRHVRGDWGDVCGHDRQQNDQALAEGGRVLSSYTTLRGDTIWVLTEADRSATTILLPEEY